MIWGSEKKKRKKKKNEGFAVFGFRGLNGNLPPLLVFSLVKLKMRKIGS